jgi:anti-anti-sigma regulatory factor
MLVRSLLLRRHARFSTTRLLQAVPRRSGVRASLQRRRLPPENECEVTLTFRISSASGEDETIIRLEGRLSANRVENLKKEIQGASGNVLLDLTDLRSADAEGVMALRSFAAEGAKLVGASPYIRQLLNETSS